MDMTGADDTSGATSASALRLEVLGALRLWRGGTELDPGPRQQTQLLALLMAREGRSTTSSELIDLIWGEQAPRSALNVLHKHVSTLRRLLEPAVAPRNAGSHLLRRGDGYLFVAGEATVDLTVFRRCVVSAQRALAERRPQTALDHYVEGFSQWKGPAGEGLAFGPSAASIFAGIDAELCDASAAAGELAVSLAQPERALTPLRLAASIAPLHEAVQSNLISVLGAAGQQAEALALFASVRARLAEDLGIDPGAALEVAHRRVLQQDFPSPRSQSNGVRLTSSRSPLVRTDPRSGGHRGGALVGRDAELVKLGQAVDLAFAGGSGLIFVEGEPGVGKTRLLEQVAAGAIARGAEVVWGLCLDGEGTPSMWPWLQALRATVDDMPVAERAKWLASELGELLAPRVDVTLAPVVPASDAQFRLFERVAAILAEVSEQQPLVLLLDDLQWADPTSLHLLTHLATRLPTATVIVGAFRDRAPTPGTELSQMLAVASRVPGHRRIQLRPFNAAEVAELVHLETGRAPDLGAAGRIHERTEGNPFFVRELTRFLAGAKSASVDAASSVVIPPTVRDVVHSRISSLDDDVREVLLIAALIGRVIDLDLLARASDLDVQTCLDSLDPIQELGLLAPTPGDPYSVRFVHDLVREAIAAMTPPRQVPRLHLRIADALEHGELRNEFVAEPLAYHLWAAGPLVDSARTMRAMMRAGRRAAAKAAYEAAARQFELAVRVARAEGLSEQELSALTELIALAGMQSMYGGSAVFIKV